MTDPWSAAKGNLARREVESYLSRSGRLAPPSLGPSEGEGGSKRGPAVEAPTAPPQPDQLARAVAAAKDANRRVFSLCIGALGLLFVLQTGVVLHGLLTGHALAWALSATLTIWPAVWWLRRLWLDRLLLGEIDLFIDALPPEKLIEVLRIIYWGPLRPKG